jgi:hypothetical protein
MTVMMAMTMATMGRLMKNFALEGPPFGWGGAYFILGTTFMPSLTF